MSVEKITTFKTSDGKVFDDYEEALNHDKYERLVERLTEIINGVPYSHMSTRKVIEHIIKYKDELKELI